MRYLVLAFCVWIQKLHTSVSSFRNKVFFRTIFVCMWTFRMDPTQCFIKRLWNIWDFTGKAEVEWGPIFLSELDPCPTEQWLNPTVLKIYLSKPDPGQRDLTASMETIAFIYCHCYFHLQSWSALSPLNLKLSNIATVIIISVYMDCTGLCRGDLLLVVC